MQKLKLWKFADLIAMVLFQSYCSLWFSHAAQILIARDQISVPVVQLFSITMTCPYGTFPKCQKPLIFCKHWKSQNLIISVSEVFFSDRKGFSLWQMPSLRYFSWCQQILAIRTVALKLHKERGGGRKRTEVLLKKEVGLIFPMDFSCLHLAWNLGRKRNEIMTWLFYFENK